MRPRPLRHGSGCRRRPPVPAEFAAFLNVPIVIDDATDRVAAIGVPCLTPGQHPTFTFTEPGRYLVICAFLPHFEAQMYGWVIVKG